MIAVRANLLIGAASLVVIAVAMSALMVAAFDWSLAQMVPGGLIGAAVWGVIHFLTAVRLEVPEGSRLPAAPSGTTVARDRWRPLYVVLWIPIFVGLTWLAGRWDLGGFFVPGQFVGYALADLAGAVLVGRWQNRHGGTVMLRWNDEKPELYTL